MATDLDVWHIAKDLSFQATNGPGVTSLETTGNIVYGLFVLTIGMEHIPVTGISLLLMCLVC